MRGMFILNHFWDGTASDDEHFFCEVVFKVLHNYEIFF